MVAAGLCPNAQGRLLSLSKPVKEVGLMQREELSAAITAAEPFIARVEAESGVEISACYQCGKCSAGCPVAFAMDYMPRQVIRLLQLGQEEEVLRSHTIWLCASCEMCYSRCPRQVALPKLMETLRIEAKARGLVAEKNVALFNDLFLKSVEKNGRLHELGLVLQYNLRSGQPLKDAGMGPVMLRNGKLKILPERIHDGGAVRRIFERTRAAEGGEFR